jgi:hypothetical protein
MAIQSSNSKIKDYDRIFPKKEKTRTWPCKAMTRALKTITTKCCAAITKDKNETNQA